MRNIFFLMVLILVATPARADVKHDAQLWSQFLANKKTDSGWLGFFEFQPRFSQDASKLNVVILRGAIGHRVFEAQSVWLGYAWIPSFQGSRTPEHRVFAQWGIEQKWDWMTLTSRTRLEGRFFQKKDGFVRFREQVKAVFPLLESIGESKVRFSAVAHEEIFFIFNTVPGTSTSGFDQNRAFLGPQFSYDRFTTEIGYLNNYLPRKMNHVVMLTLAVQL